MSRAAASRRARCAGHSFQHCLLIAFAQGIEQDEVFQPPGILGAEMVEAVRALRPGAFARKLRAASTSSGSLCWNTSLVVDCATASRGSSASCEGSSQPCSARRSRLISRRIAGESRGRRIRRIPVGGRAERQHLPQSLPRRCEKVEKLVGRRPEVADTAARRKRGRVQQNSGRARKRHHSWTDLRCYAANRHQKRQVRSAASFTLPDSRHALRRRVRFFISS